VSRHESSKATIFFWSIPMPMNTISWRRSPHSNASLSAVAKSSAILLTFESRTQGHSRVKRFNARHNGGYGPLHSCTWAEKSGNSATSWRFWVLVVKFKYSIFLCRSSALLRAFRVSGCRRSNFEDLVLISNSIFDVKFLGCGCGFGGQVSRFLC
jgi:hypothetical protein